MRIEPLLKAAAAASAANAAAIVDGDGRLAVNKAVLAYAELLKFALEFYGAIDSFADRRLVHAVHVLLQRRTIETVVFAIRASSFRSPERRDDFAMRVIRNLGQTDRSNLLLERLTELSERGSGSGGGRRGAAAGGRAGGLPQALNQLDTSKTDGFRSIVGIEDEVADIRARVEKSLASHVSVSFVLYGPPGTGKTSMAMAIGAEYKLPVFSVSAAGLGGMYVGEKEANLTAIFDYVRSVGTDLVLFIDEADSFVRAESEADSASTRMVRQTIVEYIFRLMDGRESSGHSVVLVMATNHPDLIVASVRNLSAMVRVRLPDEAGMRTVVAYYRNVYRLNMTGEDMQQVAREFTSRRYSPSNVNLMFRRLASKVVYTLLTERLERVPFMRTLFAADAVAPMYTLGGARFEGDPTTALVITVTANGAPAALDSSRSQSEDLMPFVGRDQLTGFDESVAKVDNVPPVSSLNASRVTNDYLVTAAISSDGTDEYDSKSSDLNNILVDGMLNVDIENYLLNVPRGDMLGEDDSSLLLEPLIPLPESPEPE